MDLVTIDTLCMRFTIDRRITELWMCLENDEVGLGRLQIGWKGNEKSEKYLPSQSWKVLMIRIARQAMERGTNCASPADNRIWRERVKNALMPKESQRSLREADISCTGRPRKKMLRQRRRGRREREEGFICPELESRVRIEIRASWWRVYDGCHGHTLCMSRHQRKKQFSLPPREPIDDERGTR